MLRENPNTTDAIIELIKTLPENEQQRIVKTVSSVQKKKNVQSEKEKAKKLKEMDDYVKKNRKPLPPGFKFDREEANSR